jgi:hypothetical protein
MAVRRLSAGLFLLASITLVGYAWFFWAGAQIPQAVAIAAIDRELPPLPVVDACGERSDLRDVARGRRSIIVFYSPSCRLCRTVLPELQPFPPSLHLLLVNEGEARPAGQEHPPGFAGALHFRDPNRVLFRSFPMSALPTVLLVDERGILRDAMVGARSHGRLAGRLIAFAVGQP